MLASFAKCRKRQPMNPHFARIVAVAGQVQAR
jgi:hypothetical protein